MMNKLIMLIGVPGSGKSTWVKHFMETKASGLWWIISSDAYIERMASIEGRTYDQVFKRYVKEAAKNIDVELKSAIDKGFNIIWDQTNLTSENRAKKLAKIPESYELEAVYFPIPDDLEERLKSRIGKNIPVEVMKSMIGSMEMPSLLEGFEKISYYESESENAET